MQPTAFACVPACLLAACLPPIGLPAVYTPCHLPASPTNGHPCACSSPLPCLLISPALPADYFPFLTDPSNLRNRTTFYHTLARLLFMEDTPAKFKSFVAPLQQVLAGLAAASSNATNAAALRASVPRETVIGLFRDLRGIATATNSRRTYGESAVWVLLLPLALLLVGASVAE